MHRRPNSVSPTSKSNPQRSIESYSHHRSVTGNQVVSAKKNSTGNWPLSSSRTICEKLPSYTGLSRKKSVPFRGSALWDGRTETIQSQKKTMGETMEFTIQGLRMEVKIYDQLDTVQKVLQIFESFGTVLQQTFQSSIRAADMQ